MHISHAHACIRHLHSTTATKCGFLPLRAEANEEEDSRKEKKEEEETGAPVVRGRGEESWSLVVSIYLVAKAVDGHGGSVEELMERDPRGGAGIAATLRLHRVAAVVARRVVEVEPQPAAGLLDAAVVVDVVVADDADDVAVRLLVDDDPRRRGRHRHRRTARHGAVAPHVAAEGLADGELEAADGAAVQLGLGERGVAGAVPVQPRLLVAGAVAAQRLERREPPPARLALEHAPARAEPRRRRPRAALLPLREEHGDGAGLHLVAGLLDVC